jgi:hypothetical protein
LFRNIRFNGNKRELLQELELLIIDEVSMVRADMLDAVDAILRHFREQPLLPFGGLQVLYIGDLYQLPPVVSKEEWKLLESHYQSPFFFDAQVIRQSPPVYLELTQIYRQNEARFIHLLNNIRNNQVGPEDLELLHDYYQPEFIPSKKDNYITLTSHNAKADSINQEELDKLRGREHCFEASVTGEFNDKAFPAEKTIRLKEGAQVMLIKNDKGETRRYYNGKIGIIKNLSTDKITLVFPDEPEELILEKEIWKNIRYNYDKEKDRVEEEELGSFSQYPIRLAWAITIHKSQGLTFEKAVIDAGASFAPGQVYVALSRLTSLRGLVLRSRISPYSISTDPRVVAYTENRLPDDIVEQQLEQEQLAFISDSLRKAFNWSRLTSQMQDHYSGYAHRQITGRSAGKTKVSGSANGATPGATGKVSAMELCRGWVDQALAQQETAQKFTRQLEQLLPAAEADGYRQLQQRTAAAAEYFVRLLDEQLIGPLQQHIGEMRIKQKMKKYLVELAMLKTVCVRKKQQVEEAMHLVTGLHKGIGTTHLLAELEENRKVAGGLADQGAPGVPGGSGGSGGSGIQGDPGVPADPGDAGRSGGPGGSGTSRKPQRGDSNRISLGLYKEGIAIAEIAARRGMAITTVESHLASFIPSGEIDIKELVPEHKMEPILSVVREIGGSALGPMKSKLGPDYSFGEIRAVLIYCSQTPTLSQTSIPS